MSGRQDTPSDDTGQDDSSGKERHSQEINNVSVAEEMLALKRAELQISLGFLTRSSILAVAKVGSGTVKKWEESGLKLFCEGTKEDWCKSETFRAFIESLDAPEPPQKKGY